MVYCGLCKWYYPVGEYNYEQCRRPDNWAVSFDKPVVTHVRPPSKFAHVKGGKCRPKFLNSNNDCKNFEEGERASEEEIDAIQEKVLGSFKGGE